LIFSFNLVSILNSFGSFGSLDLEFRSPSGVAVDSAGNIYVSDIYNNRIQKFDATGAHLLSFGNSGPELQRLLYPEGVSIGPAGYIYVTDTYNSRIHKYDANGVNQYAK